MTGFFRAPPYGDRTTNLPKPAGGSASPKGEARRACAGKAEQSECRARHAAHSRESDLSTTGGGRRSCGGGGAGPTNRRRRPSGAVQSNRTTHQTHPPPPYGIPWHLRSQGVLESACSLGAGGYALFSLPEAPPPHCLKQSSMRFCRSGSYGSGIVWQAPSETSAAVMNAIRIIVCFYSPAGTASATCFRRARPSS